MQGSTGLAWRFVLVCFAWALVQCAGAHEAPPDADAAGALCESAIRLVAPQRVVNQRLTGPVVRVGCAFGPGMARFYRTALAPGAALHVAVTSDRSIDLGVSVFAGCASDACLARAAGSRLGPPVETTYSNTTNDMQDMTIAVVADGADDAGAFALGIDIVPPVAGHTCGAALAVGDRGVVTDATAGYEVPFVSPCRPHDRVATLFYRVTVPAGDRVVAAAADPQVASQSAEVSLFDNCDNRLCLASGPSRARWLNTTTGPIEATIGVAPRFSTPASVTTAFAVGTPASNTSCTEATVVNDGDDETVTDAIDGGPETDRCGVSLPSPRYFRIHVPARRSVAVHGTNGPVMAAFDDCTIATCRGAGVGDTLHWSNGSTRDVDLTVVASPDASTPFAPYALHFALGAPGTNAQCDDATWLAGSTTLTDLAVEPSALHATACTSAALPSRYWTVPVRAGQEIRVIARVHDGTLADPVVSIAAACTDGACLDGGASGAHITGSRWTNRTSRTQSVVVAVGIHQGDAARVRFDLAVAVEYPPTTSTCAEIPALAADGATVFAWPATPPWIWDCQQSLALESVHSVSIPAGSDLNVHVESAAPPFARLSGFCNAAACLPTSVSADGRTVRHANTTGADETVILAVGAGSWNVESSPLAITATLSSPAP